MESDIQMIVLALASVGVATLTFGILFGGFLLFRYIRYAIFRRKLKRKWEADIEKRLSRLEESRAFAVVREMAIERKNNLTGEERDILKKTVPPLMFNYPIRDESKIEK